jgi:Plasma-membrane choline transporter
LTSAKEAFFLLARNIFRVGAIHVFGGLALFTGKVFIIACTVAASFFYLDKAFNKDLNGIVGNIFEPAIPYLYYWIYCFNYRPSGSYWSNCLGHYINVHGCVPYVFRYYISMFRRR